MGTTKFNKMREDEGIIILCFLLLICLPTHLLLASPSSSSFSCHPDQRHALLRFIHSLSITDNHCPDTYHPKVDSWREDEDCCSWEGVTCDNFTGDVIGLDLTCAGLRGSINSSSPLFSLRHLRHLSLAENDLLGSAVPPEIGIFSRMTRLNLSSSGISGILPTEISQLSKLVSLDLSFNIEVEMKDHIVMLVSNHTQMEELHLQAVNMSTVTPTSFMNFSSSLISLKLSDCWLGGNFPEFIFGLPNLQVIDLSGNDRLSGILPEHKWSSRLEYLSLRGCSFNGAVPNSIGNLSRLTYLDLSINNFTGEFDLGLLSTLENLHSLDLSELSVSGKDANHEFSLPKLQELRMSHCNLNEFPSFLYHSKDMTILELGGNKIPEIPSLLGSIGTDTLEELDLGNNIIRGSIPPSICQLASLSSISLYGNKLTGVIPLCIGNLTNLWYLTLRNNSLSGPLPPSLANCTSLEYLDVSYNSIGGASPTWLSTSSISDLNLRANNLVSGWPTDVFLQSTSLSSIDLSDNKLEGPLPLPSYATIYYLVSSNHFSGNISSLICNATYLQNLDLSNNSLTGTLPDCLKNVTTGLFNLNLRANEFQGQIPEIFSKGSNLRSVDLSRNQFEGPLPRSLSNCEILEALNVGDNNIVDSFPNWLGELPLKILSLRSNNFQGHVFISSEGTHHFSEVRVLDLSRNNFEGGISDKFISELLGMTRDDTYGFPGQYMATYNGSGEYYSAMIDLKGREMEMVKINVQFAMLDLSSNRFQGEIPRSIGLLKSLKVLNFSCNGLTGSIPSSVGDLTDLEAMDLSSNHLIREIPKELVKLTLLAFLNLSRNNLTGPIPLGGQFNTFSNSSFEGNLGLCGIPLTRSCGQGHKEAQPMPEEMDEGGLAWKYVAVGFGSGMGMGISLGYMVLEMGRPLWLVRMVIQVEASCKIRSRGRDPQGGTVGGKWRGSYL